MRIAVCDDSRQMREQVGACINAFDVEYEVVEFEDGSGLVGSKEQFDLVFLDIEMPILDGMSAAKKLREQKNDVPIVFLTSHDEMVYNAFKVKAFRFLRKPVDYKEVHDVLCAIEEEMSHTEKIMITQKRKVWELPLKKVLYLEAYGDGTYIYDTWGNVYESSEQLKVWEGKLQNKYFYRIHKSFLIALEHVRGVENDIVKIGESKVSLKIARRNVGEFKKAYLEYIDKHAKVI